MVIIFVSISISNIFNHDSNYKQNYLPEDNYQMKRNKEAQMLKQMVLKPLKHMYTDASFDDNDTFSIEY